MTAPIVAPIAPTRETIATWLTRQLEGRKFLTTNQVRERAEADGLNWDSVRGIADGMENVERAGGYWRIVRAVKRRARRERNHHRAPAPPQYDDDADEEEETPEPARVAEDPIARLQHTVNAAGLAGKQIDVFRDHEGRPAYVGSVTASEFSLRWLARTYGGGRYIIEGLEVHIEGPPRVGSVPPATVAPAVPVPPMDPWAMMLRMQEQQSALLTALLTRQQTPALDPVALLDKLDAMAQRRVGPAATPAPFDQLREAIKLGYDTAKGRPAPDSDDEEDGDPMLRRLLSVADNVTGIIKEKMSGPSPAPVPTAPPGTVPEGRDPRLPAPPVTLMQRIGRELAPYMAPLTVQARRKASPAEVAQYIVRALDEPMFQMLAEASERPQFVEDITAEMAPGIPPDLAPWFNDLAGAMQRELAATTVSDEDDEGNNGDGTG